jgi:hypothetical protein
MAVTNSDTNNIEKYIQAQASGSTDQLPPPEGIYYRPAYTMTSYRNTIDEWVANYRASGTQEISISFETGKKTTLKDLGFTKNSGNGGFSYCPFSFGASFSDEKSRESIAIDENGSDVTVVLTYKDMRAFEVRAGPW